jgi:ABC-type dipeptide/oligopeptide/nickel transport system permease subunit
MSGRELAVPLAESVAVAGVAPASDRFLRRAVRSRLFVTGAVITTIYAIVGSVGLVLLAVPSLHHLYLGENLSVALSAPGSHGLLGTDELGRSMALRLIVGCAVSLGISVSITLVSVLVGGILGLTAGYFGGRYDRIVSGVIDVTWGFPVILLAAVLAGVFQPGVTIVVLAIACINWAGFARILRGEALTLREREFVKASRALGVRSGRIIARHLVPNVVAPTIVLASYYLAVAVIAEAGLSFIGVGIQPPTPSLGGMIADGQNYWTVSSWIVLLPAGVLATLVIGLNALGDGLRDVLDPRLRGRL